MLAVVLEQTSFGNIQLDIVKVVFLKIEKLFSLSSHVGSQGTLIVNTAPINLMFSHALVDG